MSGFNESDIEACIQLHFPDDLISVSGDGRHFGALIVSQRFEGLRPLERHRLVYEALGEHMRDDIHALSIKAFTPEEYGNN
jgi:acid stress-induced BolA-like protein IbaG/YrbA